jgi:hypothetical protein
MKLQQSHWTVYFIFWFLVVVLVGAVVGAISFPLLGPLFGSPLTPVQHAIVGARHLGFIVMIWAPGIALVLCAVRAHRNKSKQS